MNTLGGLQRRLYYRCRDFKNLKSILKNFEEYSQKRIAVATFLQHLVYK